MSNDHLGIFISKIFFHFWLCDSHYCEWHNSLPRPAKYFLTFSWVGISLERFYQISNRWASNFLLLSIHSSENL
jgi:hypothetical protein